MSQKSCTTEGSPQAGDRTAFDYEDWKRRLYELNDWTSGPGGERLAPAQNAPLTGYPLHSLKGYSDPFAQARLQAALKRWHAGKGAWNVWAKAMWGLREELEAAELWAKGRDAKATDAQLLFLHHASVEFDDLGLPGRVDFSEFLFPGRVSFRRTRFGDKEAARGGALFIGAQFHGGDARFDEAEFHGGKASFYGAEFHGGDAWFVKAQFHGGDAEFNWAEFHGGDSWFRSAQFHGGAASFYGAEFHGGDAVFNWAEFHGGDASFYGAEFHGGKAAFEEAQFHGGDAWFQGAQFGDPAKITPGSVDYYKIRVGAYFVGINFKNAADFERCQINYQITFVHARFDSTANFKGITSNVGFTLSEAYFHRVPDFTESVFHRPPRLDDVEVRPTRFGPVTEFSEPETWRDRLLFWRRLKWDRDAPAKFRELKRFAIESQDSRSELAFHAEEIRSARWIKDKPWRHPDFWFGYLYGIFSNFGRSILRPFLLWVAMALVFVCIYLSAHIDHPKMPDDGTWSGWVARNGDAAAMTWTAFRYGKPCTTGKGDNIVGLKKELREGTDAFWQALRLSLANAFVFGDLGGAEGALLTYGCLYGLERVEPEGQRTNPEQRSWITRPYLPSDVLWAVRAQEALSAFFIFLFGLGLRNMLKLK